MVSMRVRIKLQELAIRHGVPEFGLPYLTIIKRIVQSANLTDDEEKTLRMICRELGVDYDRTFKKLRKAGEKE